MWRGPAVIGALFFLVAAGCLARPADVPDGPLPSPAEPPVVVFEDGAEGDAQWTTMARFAPDRAVSFLLPAPHPTAAGWHRTEQVARSGTHSWTMQDEALGRYRDNQQTIMTSPAIDLGNVTGATWSFWMRGDSEASSGEDFAWQVSRDGARFEDLGSTDLPVPEWTEVRADLSAYVGQVVWLRFDMFADWCGRDTPGLQERFCNDGDQLGYFLDDIQVMGHADAPAAP